MGVWVDVGVLEFTLSCLCGMRRKCPVLLGGDEFEKGLFWSHTHAGGVTADEHLKLLRNTEMHVR